MRDIIPPYLAFLLEAFDIFGGNDVRRKWWQLTENVAHSLWADGLGVEGPRQFFGGYVVLILYGTTKSPFLNLNRILFLCLENVRVEVEQITRVLIKFSDVLLVFL